MLLVWPAQRKADAPAVSARDDDTVEDVAFDDACRRLDALSLRLRELPYQVTGRSLAAATAGLTCWRRGEAILCFGAAAQGGLVVQSLVDPDPGQRDAEALVRRLAAAHPSTKITVPQLQRRDLGGEALERAGFSRMPLDAVLMRRAIG